jgi:hypothetical protein
MKVPPALSGGESRTKEGNVMELQPLNLDKEEILRAIDTLAQSGINISVEQIQAREGLLMPLVELTREFRPRLPSGHRWPPIPHHYPHDSKERRKIEEAPPKTL